MFTVRILRLFFLLISVISGYYIGSLFMADLDKSTMIGAFAGGLAAIILMLLEVQLRKVSLRNLSAGVFGMFFGFFIAWILTLILRLLPMDQIYYSIFQIVFTIIFCYLGMMISIKGKDDFNLIIPYVRFSAEESSSGRYLLDTSVIVDGRIIGICESGFIKGKLLVPRFILSELQMIADSSDGAKRASGRRGLDMLNQLKKVSGVEVIIQDEELPAIQEVDAKLIRLAKIFDYSVITNDMNLNKIAKLEGVSVLNINDLASALRLVVSPGEVMNVFIRKEGKEKNQGVAYMEDGTMIVVDNARRLMNKTVQVTVSSVLQTTAGRMIFANLVEHGKKNGDKGIAQRA